MHFPSPVLRTVCLAGAFAIAISGTASPVHAQAVATPSNNSSKPNLVVLITVDQMRPDYLDRYAKQLTGGYARLLRNGAVFTNAFQDHAITETAPGHATTLSGRFPRSTGIALNSLGVNDPDAPPLVGSPGDGAWPARFHGTTLIDWMMAKDPRSRALSVSRKDRAAILPIGRSKQTVLWYAKDGHFTTSRYYADTLPTWVTAFNARKLPLQYVGQAWTPLLPDSAYSEPDSVPYEGGGTDFVFPHMVSADTAKALAGLIQYPFMDELTIAAALDGVNAMQLGTGPATDLLSISLSTTDAIGHRYGPDSKEIHDQVLRVDRLLNTFLDSLYKLRDSTHVVLALTADHGVTPLPELTAQRTHSAVQRIDLSGLAKAYQTALAPRGVPPSAFRVEEAILLVDRAAFAAAHVNVDSAIAAFAAEIRKYPGVARVDDPKTLATADTVHDAVARRWLHSIPPEIPVALVTTLKPGNVWGSYASAMHGQPSDIDAHVPLIFLGTPFKPGRYNEFVRVVDLAPTLAAVIGVTPTERVDGHPLSDAMR